MNAMKRILFFIFALLPLLYSCKDEISMKAIDPKLNISEYTFSKDGGHLEVYSTTKTGIYFSLPGGTDTTAIETREEYGVPILEGEWYKVTFTAGRINDIYSQKRIITIDVKPNDTGKERTIPFDIMAGNFGCQTSYKQAAE